MGTPSVASAAIVPAPSYPYLLSRSRMLVLVLMLLVGSSQGTSLERPERALLGGNAIDLQPAGLYGAPDACRPSTVYSTRVQYSTVVIPSTVYNNDVRYLTQTSVRTQQVFTTLYSEVVRPQVVQSVVFQTRVVIQTQDNVQTRVVTLPPQVSYVQRTQEVVRTQVQYQTRYVTRTQQVPTTIVRNVASTVVVPQQVVSTVYRTQVVTRTQQLPGQTRVIPSTPYSTGRQNQRCRPDRPTAWPDTLCYLHTGGPCHHHHLLTGGQNQHPDTVRNTHGDTDAILHRGANTAGASVQHQDRHGAPAGGEDPGVYPGGAHNHL